MKHHPNGRMADPGLGSKMPAQTGGTPSVEQYQNAPAANPAYTREREQDQVALPQEGIETAAGLLSASPRRKNPLWMNVISVFLCVTLSLMSWNETSIA